MFLTLTFLFLQKKLYQELIKAKVRKSAEMPIMLAKDHLKLITMPEEKDQKDHKKKNTTIIKTVEIEVTEVVIEEKITE